MKTPLEKLRIALSRLVVIFALSGYLCTSSYWEKTEGKELELFLFFIGMVMVAIASMGRMWCSLYIAGYKDRTLITKGPYSLCRNPLYFFSFIGFTGIGFATETLLFPLLCVLVFAASYGFIIKREETRLRQLFGSTYDEYKAQTPAFWPRFSNFSEPENYVVRPIVYRQHIFDALWFVWIVGILEVIEGLKDIGYIKPLWCIY